MTDDVCAECKQACSSDCKCWCHGKTEPDDEHINIHVDCGHVTSEPVRCPECMELFCPPCLREHQC